MRLPVMLRINEVRCYSYHCCCFCFCCHHVPKQTEVFDICKVISHVKPHGPEDVLARTNKTLPSLTASACSEARCKISGSSMPLRHTAIYITCNACHSLSGVAERLHNYYNTADDIPRIRYTRGSYVISSLSNHGHLLNQAILASPVGLCQGWQSGSNIQLMISSLTALTHMHLACSQACEIRSRGFLH